MNVRRADVALMDWIYSDRTGSKVRPAVVVHADSLNGRLTDTVLVSITRSVRAPGVAEALLDPAVETRSGLFRVSVASCNNLQTLDQSLTYRTMGVLSDAAMRQIDACLKRALGLP